MADNVNNPLHYNKGEIETIDYIIDVLGKYEAVSYCQGNVIKYTGSRLFNKGNPIEDAKKARWYLDKMIKLLEETKGINWGWKMTLTFVDICDRLSNLDEVTLLEVLDISSEEIVVRFQDKVEEKADQLEEDLT